MTTAPQTATAEVEHGEYRSTKIADRKLMMWIFLASDCMFFGALIGTYIVYNGRSLEGPYPTDVFDIPLNNRQHLCSC